MAASFLRAVRRTRRLLRDLKIKQQRCSRFSTYLRAAKRISLPFGRQLPICLRVAHANSGLLVYGAVFAFHCSLHSRLRKIRAHPASWAVARGRRGCWFGLYSGLGLPAGLRFDQID